MPLNYFHLFFVKFFHDLLEFVVTDLAISVLVEKADQHTELFLGNHLEQALGEIFLVDESRIVLVEGLEHRFVLGFSCHWILGRQ